MFNRKKNIIILFLFLLLFGFFSIKNTKQASAINFTPQVTIPGSNFEAGTSTNIENSTITIGKYIKSIYNYLIAIVGLVAAIVLMLAGVIWLTAGGNTSKISQAKGLMMGSFTGIVLVLTSYIILKTINPGLIDFKNTSIEQIEPIVAIKNICTWYENTCPLTNYEEKNTDECPPIPSTINSSIAICCCHQDYSLINEYAYDPKYIAPGKALADSLNPNRDPNQDCLVAPNEWKDSKNGKYCWGVSSSGFCYNQICWEGEGKRGEPCGSEENARCLSFYTVGGRRHCYNIKNSNGSITKWYRNVKSGRQCDKDSLCCYPKQ